MAKNDLGRIRKITPYQEINEILVSFVEGVLSIFNKNLCGIYLTGSLSYGDFNANSSDIDLTVILRKTVSSKELERVEEFHIRLEKKHEKWAKRLECTYTPIAMLASILPPGEPRPWYCGFESFLYEEAPYGNEWIINNYLLYHFAIPLFGPDFKELMGPIGIEEVQKACIRDLFVEWEPKINNLAYLNNSHNQSYLILNLCRILYTVLHKTTGSKKVSAEWVKQEFGLPWKDLIESAESWQYGKEMDEWDKTIEFINFAVNEISRTAIFDELREEIECIHLSNKSV
jgi:predicted nucleotidyltransferase